MTDPYDRNHISRCYLLFRFLDGVHLQGAVDVPHLDLERIARASTSGKQSSRL
jgi:hypothetical protein